VDAQWVERAMDLADAHAHESWRRGATDNTTIDNATRNALRTHLSTALTGAPAQPAQDGARKDGNG
jgi:hypothetical protein